MVLAGITSRTKAAKVLRREMHVTEYRGTNFRKILQERESLRGKKKSLVIAWMMAHQILRQEGSKSMLLGKVRQLIELQSLMSVETSSYSLISF